MAAKIKSRMFNLKLRDGEKGEMKDVTPEDWTTFNFLFADDFLKDKDVVAIPLEERPRVEMQAELPQTRKRRTRKKK